MRMIPQLLQTIESMLPPWLLWPLAIAVFVIAVPTWLNWVRTRQIRGQLRRALRASDPATRQRHTEQAFALSAGKPRRLVALTDEAVKLNQKVIWKRSLAELVATGKYPEDVKRIRGQVEAKRKRGGHPLEEAVIIERMWSQGLHEAARDRLAEVRNRFPADPDLEKLERDLA